MKPKFVRFSQLADLHSRYDYHIHTSWSDGQATPEEFIRVALQKNLDAIAFTDHVRKTSTWFDLFVDEVKKLQEKTSELKIYIGIEAKALTSNGDLDATEHMIKRSDIVLGAVHRYSEGGNYLDFRKLSPEKAAKTEFKLARGLLRNPSVDVLAHPGGVFERQYKRPFPKEYLEEIIKVANGQNKALEINSSYLGESSYQCHLALYSKLNPLVSLGSDAHHPNELGTVLDLPAGFFRRAK